MLLYTDWKSDLINIHTITTPTPTPVSVRKKKNKDSIRF